MPNFYSVFHAILANFELLWMDPVRQKLQKHKIVNCFGPWAPSTRIRSISPVRLGPVMNEIMLG